MCGEGYAPKSNVPFVGLLPFTVIHGRHPQMSAALVFVQTFEKLLEVIESIQGVQDRC